jgi:hypothetical protein
LPQRLEQFAAPECIPDLAFAVGLARSVEFQQVHGGDLQIRRGYLAVGDCDQCDRAYPDRISDTCQNLSGMA